MIKEQTARLPESVRLIIFDWDGTLMDSQSQIVYSMQAAIEDLRLECRSTDECCNIIGLGLKEAVDVLYPGRDEVFLEQFVERYRHHWFAVAHQSELFPGARETLELLKDAGFKLAVATGKGRAGLDKVLQETGLTTFFAATRCSDESLSKPHPRMLHEILASVDLDPSQALMIGDTEYDLAMANTAGVGPVAVSYGVHARERLLQHNPLVCLDGISELADWLADTELLDSNISSQTTLAIGDQGR
ncbi:MAG: HAD-IA family hydrolase [Thiogranum sp.]|nr:HAD-IA family hydrolase [Thiogranum sp.]